MWTSERVTAGTPAHAQAKRQAEAMAREHGKRVEWVDEYNDYSVKGVFRVR